ncbi:DedA family protein [Frigidibacter sp. MR17.14]|uniref:DedA family protein n=1 Tax=Frigidibacter sp. MR17.14 TaxID=3126509 RepID=UPI003012D40E
MFEWITGFIAQAGLLGVAALMFVENVFPPIPSELVMPLAGFNAAQGEMALIPSIMAGSAGSLAGAWFWYWVARRTGAERIQSFVDRHGRWTAISGADLEKSQAWFDRRGGWAVLLGRLIPTVRTFVSVPAGLARMPIGRFLALSLVGTLIWNSILAISGFLLQSQYHLVAEWLDPLAWIVLFGFLAAYLWKVFKAPAR